MKRKFRTVFLTVAIAVCMSFGFAACGEAEKGERGEKGETGVGIESMEVDERGHLIVTMTDGTVKDLGKITADGVSPQEGTEGLQYQKRKDEEGNEYAAVVGLGTAWDTDIIIPSTYRGLPVKEIGEGAFSASYDARNATLTSVIISDEIITIGAHAFNGCIGLTEIAIPENVTSIGIGAFAGCSGLEKMIVDTNNAAYSSQGGVLYDKAKTKIVYIPQGIKGAVTIPDSVTEIGERAFDGRNGLENVTIGSGVTSIGYEAFEDCSGLTSVTIGSGVTEIGGSAFYRCSGLKNVIWNAENCTEAGSERDSIFSDCTNLNSVIFGENVKTIPAYAFYDCSGLTEIHYTGTIEAWKQIEKGIYWNNETGNYTVICTDGTIAKDGKETKY